ncbi:TVP38/TMEM64 family protein [Robertmurraya kyonggiensis]|uniref:TVP38/TMEM64 family membrane protein n=1 Tax=Robertmurraya kyonggiensis TaxID=1037680 RepID=A0A4U1D106_9BACI|nr:VTT domain-containing protein [Robertmurraya kyonggiensis]TKC15754.1 TVP38/TMEM64 family protein [Robertmurraya kyonggiensis]
MEDQMTMLLVMVETGGILAPIVFVLFHCVRQFFFFPVAVICIAGGVLFGTVAGTFYSMVGLFLSSILFYVLIKRMPKTHQKLSLIKKKWFGEYRNLTTGQVAILRLIPFIHYHLLSFCLMERHRGFRGYMKASFLTNIPLALFYTVFGEFISRFTPTMILVILFSLSILVYLLRERMTIIKWREFFKETA